MSLPFLQFLIFPLYCYLFKFTYHYTMSLSKIVMNSFYLQSSFFYNSLHILGVVHLTISICYCCKIETYLRKAEGSRFIFLPIPEGLHDIESCLLVHCFCRTGQYREDLLLSKTVQKLAHPDCIKLLYSGENCFMIEKIDAVAINTLSSLFIPCLFAHHFQLLGQIHDGDINLFVVRNASESPSSCISSYIQQPLRMIGKDNLKCLIE